MIYRHLTFKVTFELKNLYSLKHHSFANAGQEIPRI